VSRAPGLILRECHPIRNAATDYVIHSFEERQPRSPACFVAAESDLTAPPGGSRPVLREANPSEESDPSEVARRYFRYGGLFVWDDGEPVSMDRIRWKDPERGSSKLGLHATRDAATRVRNGGRWRAYASSPRMKAIATVPLHQPRQPDFQQDLPENRLPTAFAM